jgi:MSHA biogenesis protein MshM
MRRIAEPPPEAPSSQPAVSQSAPKDWLPSSTSFPYRDYLAAQHQLGAAARKGAFYALVTAASGMGKTSLMRDFHGSLDRHRYQLVYLSAAGISLLGISRFFAQTCHVTPKRSYLETTKVLADALKSQPTHPIIWIDEADRLPTQTLAEIRILAECDLEVPQMFSIIFAGLPELGARLANHVLYPLKRRISVRVELSGLCRDELDAFVLHRFGSRDSERVPHELRDEIFERTLATPALLDRICRVALERAGTGAVSSDHLREAFDAAGL